MEQRAYESNKELNRELFEHNIAQRREKEDQQWAEREADKQMIQSVMEKERMMDALEREERVKISSSDILILVGKTKEADKGLFE